MEIIHKPGITHILPDALSRLYPPTNADQEETNKLNQPMIASIENPINTKSIMKELYNVTTPAQEDRANIIELEHQMGHFGVEIILRNLWKDKKVYWDGMCKDVEHYIKQCEPCLRYNITRQGFYPLRSLEADGPMDHIAIDLGQPGVTTEDGYNYILLIIDVATRYMWIRALKTKVANEVAWELLKVFAEFGFPKIIQSDNGKEFVNTIILAMNRLFKVKSRLITPYHPQANGIAERGVGIAKLAIYKHANGEDITWNKALPTIQMSCNTRITERTGSTPFSLMFGRAHNFMQTYKNGTFSTKSPQELIDKFKMMTNLIYPAIKQRLKGKLDKQAKYFEKSHKIIKTTFPEGSTVMVLNKNKQFKSEPRYEGPFRVVRVTKGNTHVLMDRANEILKRNYTISELKLVADLPTEFGNSEVIEKIIKHRNTSTGKEYLIRWLNTNGIETWEPESSFDDPAALTNYWRKQQQRAKQFNG